MAQDVVTARDAAAPPAVAGASPDAQHIRDALNAALRKHEFAPAQAVMLHWSNITLRCNRVLLKAGHVTHLRLATGSLGTGIKRFAGRGTVTGTNTVP